MKNEKLSFLQQHFPSFEIQFSEDGDFAKIINPFFPEHVRVQYVPEDEYTPFIVYFAFQHCHMCDEEDIVDYISSVINGDRFSIEFFRNGTRCFGSDISARQLEGLTYESLEQFTGYWGIRKLKELADTFKVRGWNPDENFDAVFDIGPDGTVTIRKIG